MENPLSNLDNRRLNVTVRKRDTLHAHASKNGHWQVLQRRKKVTLCSRTCLTKEAEGARYQRSTEISDERRKVIADLQPAFPLDRDNCRARAKIDRDARFPAIPLCVATVACEPSLVDANWSAHMTAISKIDDAITHTVANIADNSADNSLWQRRTTTAAEMFGRALHVLSSVHVVLQAAVSCSGRLAIHYRGGNKN